MHTLSETLDLCRGSDRCDPLFNTSAPDAMERVQETPEGLLLLGIDDGDEYACDLLIAPVEGGWTLAHRDPLDATEPLWGREWQRSDRVFSEWSDLVSAAYSL